MRYRGLILCCVLLAVELVCCGYLYITGRHGLIKTNELARRDEQLRVRMALLEENIADIRYELQAWKEDDCYYEQYARAHLQMGKPGEVWYRY